jgi:hypothetical protein
MVEALLSPIVTPMLCNVMSGWPVTARKLVVMVTRIAFRRTDPLSAFHWPGIVICLLTNPRLCLDHQGN